MMQWLERFFAMKLLAQKSLKMELRLKSYESLNFQGLKHKITELKIDFLLKLGLNSNLWKTQEPR
jgi:hypothetical protein